MDENTPTDEPIRDVTIVAPAPSAVAAREAMTTYQEIQKVFDEKLPNAIITIKGKQFRKKSYWRAIATAFQVNCEIRSAERIEVDGDWGYTAIARAAAPDGRTSDGDGSCMASEKVDRDGNPTAMQTVHNVRSHAITRAKNRAISDLVGFGEVSADELPPDQQGDDPPPNNAPRSSSQGSTGSATLANPNQIKMLSAKGYARAEVLTGESGNHAMCGSIVKAAMRLLGFEDKKQITAVSIDAMVKAIDGAILDPEDEAHAMIPEEKF